MGLWAGSSPHTRQGHAQLINVRKMAIDEKY